MDGFTANAVVDAGGGYIEGPVARVRAVEGSVGAGGGAGFVAAIRAVAIVVVHLMESERPAPIEANEITIWNVQRRF